MGGPVERVNVVVKRLVGWRPSVASSYLLSSRTSSLRESAARPHRTLFEEL
nr:MAG TPA: hypothetical protein [Caudoviricetes sp.]